MYPLSLLVEVYTGVVADLRTRRVGLGCALAGEDAGDRAHLWGRDEGVDIDPAIPGHSHVS